MTESSAARRLVQTEAASTDAIADMSAVDHAVLRLEAAGFRIFDGDGEAIWLVDDAGVEIEIAGRDDGHEDEDAA
jgi:hypothetical protein